MANEYEEITLERFQKLLIDTCRQQPDRWNMRPGQEVSYDWYLPQANKGPRIAIRVYTSIVFERGKNNDGVSRSSGKDAIRICAVKAPGARTERMLFVMGRVNRVPGWEARLRSRLVDAWKLITRSERCPACQSYMSPKAVRERDDRNRPKGPVKRYFLGCTRYPDCRGTRNIKDQDGKSPKTLDAVLSIANRPKARPTVNG
jgi:ssDNA-binding Zn-finger/Zn-ribbon topoisomerase 1